MVRDPLVGTAPLPPKRFEVFLLSDDGRRFAGRKTFIEEVERAVPHFYDNVGQSLERWVARPPKPVLDKELDGEPEATNGDGETTEELAPHSERPSSKPENQHTGLADIPQHIRRGGTGE